MCGLLELFLVLCGLKLYFKEITEFFNDLSCFFFFKETFLLRKTMSPNY